jgi:hypothetical protein
MAMLGSSCSPCCKPAIPCISNQGNFTISVEISASDYLKHTTDTFGVTGDPDLVGERKTSTFFQGSLFNGTFVADSFVGIQQGNFKLYNLFPPYFGCCGVPALSLRIYDSPQPVNYELRIRLPVVFLYRERRLMPDNLDDCPEPQHRDVNFFVSDECCAVSNIQQDNCLQAPFVFQTLETFAEDCVNNNLTDATPYIIFPTLPQLPTLQQEIEGGFLISSSTDFESGSLQVTVESITITPL